MWKVPCIKPVTRDRFLKSARNVERHRLRSCHDTVLFLLKNRFVPLFSEFQVPWLSRDWFVIVIHFYFIVTPLKANIWKIITCDVSRVLYGATRNSNWPITVRTISQTFYKYRLIFLPLQFLLIASKIAKIKCILHGYKINMARRKNANDIQNRYGLLPRVNFLFNHFLLPDGPFQIM